MDQIELLVKLKYPTIDNNNWDNRFNLLPEIAIDEAQRLFNIEYSKYYDVNVDMAVKDQYKLFNEFLLEELYKYESKQNEK